MDQRKQTDILGLGFRVEGNRTSMGLILNVLHDPENLTT